MEGLFLGCKRILSLRRKVFLRGWGQRYLKKNLSLQPFFKKAKIEKSFFKHKMNFGKNIFDFYKIRKKSPDEYCLSKRPFTQVKITSARSNSSDDSKPVHKKNPARRVANRV